MTTEIQKSHRPQPGRFAKATPTRKPSWLRMELPGGEGFADISRMLRERKLHTVCEEAKCPNLGECWKGGTATIMVLGETCTRACRFCSVKTGNPRGLTDAEEPRKVAESCKLMKLRYVVLTSVDRDDLADGGAAHFAACVREAKARVPGLLVETLVPDFCGQEGSIRTIVESGVDVFAQNLETVKRLTHPVRDHRASYELSLEVLCKAKEIKPNLITKSSLMLGLGETERELIQAMRDLREVGVDILTLGQYLRPSLMHLPVQEYVTPARFEALRQRAMRMGYAFVASGPLVRSSYKAAEQVATATLASRLSNESFSNEGPEEPR
jgi:lipoyl synthase